METWNVKNCYEENKGKTEALNSMQTLFEEKSVDEVGAEMVMLAAQYAHTEALEWLNEQGIDLNITDKYEYNPLHEVAKKDFRYYRPEKDDIRNCTRFLLSQGISALRKDENEYMACYHYAARSGNYEFVEELNGKKLDLTDKSGNTGIHIACDYVRHAMSNLHYASNLVEKTAIKYGETIERLKDRNLSDEDMAKYMENNRIKTVEQAEEEYAGLIAEIDNYYKTVKAFVDGGLDPDEKNNYGETGLDIAVRNEAKKIASFLMGEDIESDEALSSGGMSIHQAVEKNDIQAIKAITHRGANVNAANNKEGRFQGWLPLAIACAHLNVEAINALIECGADVSLKDDAGHTGLFFIGNEAHVTEKDKRIKIVLTVFKKAGYDFNSSVNDDSDTLLNYHCKYNSSYDNSFIPEFLRIGADVNISNRFGETPLMHICKQNSAYVENIQLSLLENGADVAAKDQNGNTPLHYAAINHSNSLAKTMAGILAEFGKVDINAVNNQGKTALDIATETGNEPLVKWLLSRM